MLVVTLAVDFVPLAVEFGAFAVAFLLLAVEFGTFVVEFVGFAVEFVMLHRLGNGIRCLLIELGVFALEFVITRLTAGINMETRFSSFFMILSKFNVVNNAL